jgi:thiamine-monophosphate kinase
MIDISDGVSKECHTLAYDNTLGIILDNLDECLSASLRKCGTLLKKDPLQWVLSGGEDYELLFTASARFDPAKIESQTGVRLTRIGIVSNKVTGVLLKSKQGKRTPLKKSGWDHMPQKRL